MFQDISIEELLEQHEAGVIQLIDVRSPGEFAEYTIKDAVNIPFFDDEERREIGTLYKQVSVHSAKQRGLEIISSKLPAFVKRFADVPGRKAVFCWRGGMRSRTTATILSLMDIHVYRLTGGIRAYRQWVVSKLDNFEFKPKCVVISGHTGSGKTEILHRLAKQGYPVIDLEGLAGHRGSIFGGIGLQPNNQKVFETHLLHELLRANEAPFVLIEGESKRIGKAVLPPFLVEAKAQGIQLQIEMPTEERVRNIIRDYDPSHNKDACLAAFRHIQKRIHTPIAAQIEQSLKEDWFEEAVERLLQYYYDPRYDYSGQQYEQPPILCKAGNVDEAVDQIKAVLQQTFGNQLTELTKS